MDIRVKRVYAKPEASDGLRVLVDRIWPRGLKKEAAGIDWWPREIAPSSGLRQWFGHEPSRWDEFRERYFRELESQGEMLAELREKAGKGPLTLVFGAREEEHNNAVALKEYLEERAR
ncbi:MAG: DUF488 domain-containing protein [Desulfobacteraceae bacterium]|nr:DUF488 domain-containing protein [Desulfobacteraceae bacterium]